MNVKLISSTKGIGDFEGKTAEDVIVYCARVSSSRPDKFKNAEGLLNYCIKSKHWSIFETASMTIEIITSKAIGIQLIRHKSFSFQEMSMRYQNVNKAYEQSIFESVELRKMAEKNRQSSTEIFDPYIENEGAHASDLVEEYLNRSKELYDKLVEAEVATECARMILPLTTKTRIYMTGNIRSWIHFLDVRDDGHAQREIVLVAKEIKKIFIQQCPIVSKALGYI